MDQDQSQAVNGCVMCTQIGNQSLNQMLGSNQQPRGGGFRQRQIHCGCKPLWEGKARHDLREQA